MNANRTSSKKEAEKPHPAINIAEAWSKLFLENKSLLHLDISNNDFLTHEIQVMSKGLMENHTILGLHMEGNEGATDAYGFIHPMD